MKILQTIKNNIPNAITCLNLVSGILACIFALDLQIDSIQPDSEISPRTFLYESARNASIMIALAAVFDFCDGLVARLLHATSAIGKELDSLCDSVSFGLAPALLVYQMIAAYSPDSMWCMTALVIAVCGVLRLARFNVDTTQSVSFLGMPIPANAIFWIGFCAVQYQQSEYIFGLGTIVVLCFIMSYLMVSNLRMFSLKFKDFSFANNWHRYLLIVAAIAFIFIQGIPGLASAILFYIILSAITHNRTKKYEA